MFKNITLANDLDLKTLAKEELIKPNPINVTLLKVKTLSTLTPYL